MEPLVHAALGGFILSFMNLYEDSRKPKNQRLDKDALWWLFFSFGRQQGACLPTSTLLPDTKLMACWHLHLASAHQLLCTQ
jgi:hypothetical protein